jgi:hypothetical protein
MKTLTQTQKKETKMNERKPKLAGPVLNIEAINARTIMDRNRADARANFEAKVYPYIEGETDFRTEVK